MTVTAELRVRASEEAESLVLALSGSLETETSPELARRLDELDLARSRVILDLADLDRIDSTGVAVILEARDRLRERRADLRIRNASAKVKKVFSLTMRHLEEQEVAPPSANGDWVSRIGKSTLELERQSFEALKQLGEIAYATVVAPFRGQKIRTASTAEQIVLFGFDAIPIISLISFLIGLIMAMQAAHQLRDFGANIFVADLVGIASTRELGPFITAVVVAGRSGSAIAAELGTMVVTEEIDALRTMGLSPTRYLVVPRFLALTIAMPCLVIIADAISILGGMIIGVTTLDIGPHTYFKQTIDAIILSDLLTGMAKSVVFGIIIANVGVFEGMHVQGGAEGVGRATTRTVVTSILLIIIADAIFTAYFHFL